MRLFFALCAVLSFLVFFADTKNAYQQAPPPTEQCYVEIDDALESYYKRKFGIILDPKTQVLPVLKALQGHPEAGALWEKMITKILDDMGFKPTTHERNLYRGTIDGKTVLVCRQVDDFAVGCRRADVAKRLIAHINEHATTESQGMGTITSRGVFNHYNGVDIHQTRDYVKLSCETYIDRVLQTHGWDKPGSRESDRHDTIPLSPDLDKHLETLSGPEEGTAEHVALEKQCGFSFRQVLGEIVYAYVVCRVDVSFAVASLSRFSSAPHVDHYMALKNVIRHLRRTKDWGLVFWREKPLESLPAVPLQQPPLDSSLPNFPKMQP